MPEMITYTADGLNMVSELYRPATASGKAPVIIFPEAFGISEHVRGRARRLAERGHLVLASDLHGDQHYIENMEDLGPLFGPLREDVGRIRARSQAALDAIVRHGGADPAKVVASGYCFGGTMSLELVRAGSPIAAAVGFHSGLQTSAPASPGSKAKVLVCIGADDPGIPPEQRAAFEAEMREAKIDWQMHLYGGVVHSFTNPEADKRNMPAFARYDAKADARSWKAFTDLLDELG